MTNKLTILAVAAMLALLIVQPVPAANVYVNNNPALYEVLPTNAYGYVIFYARGVAVQDPDIYVDRYPSKLTVDNTYHPDHTNITGQNEGMLLVTLKPDGVSEPVMLQAGEYTAYMRQGNGDQPEQYRFKIGGGDTERVVFLGAAKPTMHKEVCAVFTVIDKPGYVIHHDEVNHTVHHEALTHQETVVDKEAWDETIIDSEPWDEIVIDVPAWDEQVYHPEVNHTIHHDAVTHQKFVVDGSYYVHDWKWFNEGHHDVLKVKCTNHAEHGEGWHVQTADCTKSYGHYITVVDVPAWNEIIVDCRAHYEAIHHNAVTHVAHHDAVTHIVHHPAETHEITVTDKEAWDEIVVDVPAWDEQVGAETHKETVCNKYGEPVPPKGAINPSQF